MKKAKRNITYSEAHNKAVRMYQRTSIFLLWAGIVNVVAIIIGVIQLSTNTIVSSFKFDWPTSGFAMCFAFQIILNSLIIQSMDKIAACVLIIALGIIFGGFFAFIGYISSRGRKFFLVFGFALYILDFASMFFVYNFGNVYRNWTNYAFTLVTHVIVLVACLIAIIQYYNVIHIEKIFKGVKNVRIEEEIESEVIARGE